VERDTIRRIKEAVRRRSLLQPFSPKAVNRALGIDYAEVFLPKHRIGNPGGQTEHFVRVASARTRRIGNAPVNLFAHPGCAVGALPIRP